MKKQPQEYKVTTIGKPSFKHLSETEKKIFCSDLLNEIVKWKQAKDNPDNKKDSHD